MCIAHYIANVVAEEEKKGRKPRPNKLHPQTPCMIRCTFDRVKYTTSTSRCTDDFNGAQLKAVCVEAGMIALRRKAEELSHEDYMDGQPLSHLCTRVLDGLSFTCIHELGSSIIIWQGVPPALVHSPPAPPPCFPTCWQMLKYQIVWGDAP